MTLFLLSILLVGQVPLLASHAATPLPALRPAHFNATFQQLRATAEQNASVRVIYEYYGKSRLRTTKFYNRNL
ncbi:MAG: hypothetical protein EOM24_19320 [Chloroflexia bacterium]|nr:hypothetical protein [Chloroflexia bacterium]